MLTLLPFDARWLRNRRGATPLMEAARTGGWRCAKHLLHLLRQQRFNEYQCYGMSKRLCLLGLKDCSGRTALELAILSGHAELANYIECEMRLVLDNTGLLSGLTVQEEADREKLQQLAQAGKLVQLRQAATRANCDLPDSDGQTALMWAARNRECNNEALWEQLVQLADPTCSDVFDISCLHHAAGSGNSAAVAALLNAGAAANVRGRCKSTSLMRAAILAPAVSAAAVGRVLLGAGADWSLKDIHGVTALGHAINKGKSELAELLSGYKSKMYFNDDFKATTQEMRVHVRTEHVQHDEDTSRHANQDDDDEDSHTGSGVQEDERVSKGPGRNSATYSVQTAPFLVDWKSIRPIGRGGFGEVHEVLTDKGVRCAAKTLRLPIQLGDQLDSLTEKVSKYVDGERNLCQLRHNNIVKFLWITQPKPAKVVVFMELLDGCTLEKFIDDKPLNEGVIRNFSYQTCSALEYMHSLKPEPVIHRDINCSNIIVLADNQLIKLIDFGLSVKLKQSVSHLTGTTQAPKGTLNFLAPELLGAGTSDNAFYYSRESDIWAFGCSVFQMVTGARPYANAISFLQIALRLERQGAPNLPSNSSSDLKDFYRQCTAMIRSQRSSAADLIRHKFLTG